MTRRYYHKTRSYDWLWWLLLAALVVYGGWRLYNHWFVFNPRTVLEKVMNFLGSDRMLFVATRRSLFEEVDRMLRQTESDRITEPDETTLKSWF